MKRVAVIKRVNRVPGLWAALAAVATLVSCSAHASLWAGGNGRWNSNGSPGWNGTGVPNAPGAVAENNLGGSTGITSTQDVSGGITIGTLSKGGTGNFTWIINLSNSITFNQDGAGPGSAVISNGCTGTSANRISLSSGTLTLADDLLIINTGLGAGSYSIGISSSIGGTGNITLYNVTNSVTAGPLSLTGASSFTGSVSVLKGAVSFSTTGTGLGSTNNILTLGSEGNGSATLVASGSGNTIANAIVVAAGSGGTLVLGSSDAGAVESKFTGPLTLNGDLSVTSSKTGAGMVSFTKPISGAGSIAKIGVGTVQFSGANAYTGSTTVTAGRLLINGATSGQSNFIVNAGGSLGGTGTVGLASGRTVTVAASGTIAPGSSGVGTLKVNGDFVLSGSACYEWEYKNGTGDLVSVTGALQLPAVATVTVTQISGTLPNPAVLFSAGSLTGAADLSGWVVSDPYATRTSGTSVLLITRPAGGALITVR
jgi:autotransporter-associated beta strand protein